MKLVHKVGQTRAGGPIDRFTRRRTALLTTFRRDGSPVGTPVTIAVDGDRAYFRTYDRSGKAKRLLRNADVEMAPATVMGHPRGGSIRASARRLEGPEAALAKRMIERRQPVLQGIMVPLLHRLHRYRTLHYELTPVETGTDPARGRERRSDTRLGRGMALLNRAVTNHLTRPLARWLPGFAIVVHVGRSSKRRYETPVNAFRTSGGYLIALTYGTESDWVRNVLAAGGCRLVTRGQTIQLMSPRIIQDGSAHLAPLVVRPVLRVLRVTEFLRFETA